MNYRNSSAIVTGGASGLGLATARRLVEQGMQVVIVDLPASDGAGVAAELGAQVRFVAADVTTSPRCRRCVAAADASWRRCARWCTAPAAAAPVRMLDKEGNPGSLEFYEEHRPHQPDRHLQHAAPGGRARWPATS